MELKLMVMKNSIKSNMSRLCGIHGMKISGDRNVGAGNKLSKNLNKICVHGFKNNIKKNKR